MTRIDPSDAAAILARLERAGVPQDEGRRPTPPLVAPHAAEARTRSHRGPQ